MKKLIEELKNLDIENDYEVPSDFKNKVMKEINDNKKNNKIKYAISSLSAVAVIVVAVFMVKNNFKNTTQNLYITNSVQESTQVSLASDSTNYFLTAPNLLEKSRSINDVAYLEDEATPTNITSDDIIKMFSKSKIIAEKIGEYVKAKCTREQALDILNGYNLTIESYDDYVIIK